MGNTKTMDYTESLKDIWMLSTQANQLYVRDVKAQQEQLQEPETVEVKYGKEYVEFNGITSREAVLKDSLFLRYMRKSINLVKGDVCKNFICVKFGYAAEYRIGEAECKVSKQDLREQFYRDGVTYTWKKKDKELTVHYVPLMRSPGKAKKGECVFVEEALFDKAIDFLTMGLYKKMKKEEQKDPEKVFKLVELCAYQTLTTAAAAGGYIQIPMENMLIVKDEEVYSAGIPAAIVRSELIDQPGKQEFVIDFDDPRTESIINKKGCTFYPEKAQEKGLKLVEKSKESLKKAGIRANGKYPGHHEEKKSKVCTVTKVKDAKIKNILWDGMGLIDDSVFPEDADGFIYCRSHFFKSCLFRGSIQIFFRDYCEDHGLDYETYAVNDMFGNERRIKDVQVIITDKSLKWLKFVDKMGGTEQKAYQYYRKWMDRHRDYFSIVKTAHKSKLGDLQISAYQMNNSLPTTDKEVLLGVAACAVEYYNALKKDDEAYCEYLRRNQNNFNINEVLLALVERNPEFVKTDIFRGKKKRDLNRLKESFKIGELPQPGDNLTIMDNPIALLLKAVGDDPLKEDCFKVLPGAVQCYTLRFKDEENLAGFRSPHNAPNNIIHLQNVYPDALVRYFSNIGQNVIVFNAIGTDTQARLSGHDVDSDFVFVTNQMEVVELARKAYMEYQTIINDVAELNSSGYRLQPEDYAKMDNKIADAQVAIGTSTDIAQLAMSYYFDGGMKDPELQECFEILSVIGQISIDLAKKEFDIIVNKEIQRIRSLPCMKGRNMPQFFADVKRIRRGKTVPENERDTLECPMDIIADIVEERCSGYADRVFHKPLQEFLADIKEKPNRYKVKMVAEAADEYNVFVRSLESKKNELREEAVFDLKNRAMSRFLNRASKKLEQATVMRLVCYAFEYDNSDVRATILNGLYREHREKFLNCFEIGEK